MKIYAPEYYKKFHCLASKCKESCCSAGWEIDIDDATADFYRNISGEFGEKLRQCIDFNNIPNFILEKNGKCPFLNDKKLCEIYINLGEPHLCQICRDHPRYYEWFDDIVECGVGLCCEEAARIILSQNESFHTCEIDSHVQSYSECQSTTEDELSFETDDTQNNALYSCLFESRDKIIFHLENSSIPFNSRIRDVIFYGYSVQKQIWDGKFDTLDIELSNIDINKSTDYNVSLKHILNFLLKLESCTDNWIPYLKDCISLFEQYDDKIYEFENSYPEVINYLKNIAIYFVWRYFLKATFDEDVLSKIGLMAISVAVLKYLFFCEWLKNGNISFEFCVFLVKRFSEEIEYSDDNLMALADACYELQSFSLEGLIELFE